MSQRVHINPQQPNYRPPSMQSYQPDPVGARGSSSAGSGMQGIGMTGNPAIDNIIAQARAFSSKIEDFIEAYSQASVHQSLALLIE
jgi:hypothetical protein